MPNSSVTSTTLCVFQRCLKKTKKQPSILYIFFVLICLSDFGNQFVTSDVTSLFSISAKHARQQRGDCMGLLPQSKDMDVMLITYVVVDEACIPSLSLVLT